MGIFRRSPAVRANLTDAEWWADAEQQYEKCWRTYLGSPETFAGGGGRFYSKQEFAVAALLCQKAVDLMHTHYVFSSMRDRQPAPRDLAIIDGYLSSLGASLSLHPEAPVAGSVREVTHRLRTIASACQHVGISDTLYQQALIQLGNTAPHINVDDIFW